MICLETKKSQTALQDLLGKGGGLKLLLQLKEVLWIFFKISADIFDPTLVDTSWALPNIHIYWT